IDANLEPMDIAKQSIEKLSAFFFDTLGLDNTFTKVGIEEKDFPVMAKKACGDGVLPGFKPLAQQDIEKIFAMCR
ncbi:MAG: NADH-dependent alcohol dehydrogenase, partial [Lachnospiraceae bacterium]|nr:NADH-dependent alcohol dehydrogenase [Lachnospiraceae bacterium]